METTVHSSETGAVIRFAGCFNSSVQHDFCNAIDQALADDLGARLEIDLSGVISADSSVLGMLLMLRQRVGSADRPVVLTGAQGGVKHLIEIANLGELFRIA